mmetsp:Transcript_106816/g.267771  ORF Transcript_106816/g.267771 Transcript_106816/m.267771 type:complete len:440 (-) Transcript_106816:87-1406(-)
MQQLIVSDFVGLQASCCHLLHQSACLLCLTPSEMSLQERVEADDVDEIELLHLLEVRRGTVEFAALHACVQETIVDHGRHPLSARLQAVKDTCSAVQVAVLYICLDHGRVALNVTGSPHASCAVGRGRFEHPGMIGEALSKVSLAEFGRELQQESCQCCSWQHTSRCHLPLEEVARGFGEITMCQDSTHCDKHLGTCHSGTNATVHLEHKEGEIGIAHGPASLKQRQGQWVSDCETRICSSDFQVLQEITKALGISCKAQSPCHGLVCTGPPRYLHGSTRGQQLAARRQAPLPSAFRSEQIVELLRIETSTYALQLVCRSCHAAVPTGQIHDLHGNAGSNRALGPIRWRGHLPQVAEGLVQAAAMGGSGGQDGTHPRREGLRGKASSGCGDADIVAAAKLRGHEAGVGARVRNLAALLQQAEDDVQHLDRVIAEQDCWK